ncbi:hypothetical protein RRG08_036718 [Elysia crispata]|uniref:Uncharacterized protein n=1 Tax=Elysia crispata TaxID=231223 RepID=A0AAE1CMK6_9GAST|nr:hypothetical protein RRG08_036718 [Elysia crispata]
MKSSQSQGATNSRDPDLRTSGETPSQRKRTKMQWLQQMMRRVERKHPAEQTDQGERVNKRASTLQKKLMQSMRGRTAQHEIRNGYGDLITSVYTSAWKERPLQGQRLEFAKERKRSGSETAIEEQTNLHDEKRTWNEITFIATSSPVVLYSGLCLGSGVMVVNKGGSTFGERQSHYPGNGQHPLVHITNGVWQQVAAVPAATTPGTWSRLAC